MFAGVPLLPLEMSGVERKEVGSFSMVRTRYESNWVQQNDKFTTEVTQG